MNAGSSWLSSQPSPRVLTVPVSSYGVLKDRPTALSCRRLSRTVILLSKSKNSRQFQLMPHCCQGKCQLLPELCVQTCQWEAPIPEGRKQRSFTCFAHFAGLHMPGSSYEKLIFIWQHRARLTSLAGERPRYQAPEKKKWLAVKKPLAKLVQALPASRPLAGLDSCGLSGAWSYQTGIYSKAGSSTAGWKGCFCIILHLGTPPEPS